MSSNNCATRCAIAGSASWWRYLLGHWAYGFALSRRFKYYLAHRVSQAINHTRSVASVGDLCKLRFQNGATVFVWYQPVLFTGC